MGAITQLAGSEIPKPFEHKVKDQFMRPPQLPLGRDRPAVLLSGPQLLYDGTVGIRLDRLEEHRLAGQDEVPALSVVGPLLHLRRVGSRLTATQEAGDIVR